MYMLVLYLHVCTDFEGGPPQSLCMCVMLSQTLRGPPQSLCMLLFTTIIDAK